MLNSASRLKGEKDWQKYEIARQLKGELSQPKGVLFQCTRFIFLFIADSVEKIRETYKEDWKSKEMKIRQRSVALYFIDKVTEG